jgi:hypothetical protein
MTAKLRAMISLVYIFYAFSGVLGLTDSIDDVIIMGIPRPVPFDM